MNKSSMIFLSVLLMLAVYGIATTISDTTSSFDGDTVFSGDITGNSDLSIGGNIEGSNITADMIGNVYYVDVGDVEDLRKAFALSEYSNIIIQLPEGLFDIGDNGIELFSNTTVFGSGWKTIIKGNVGNGANGGVLYSTEKKITNIILKDLTIDGNSNSSGIHITHTENYPVQNLEFNHLQIKNSFFAGMHLKGVSNVLITNCLIEDVVQQHAIYLRRVKDFTIKNNIFKNTQANGLWIASCQTGDIENNKIYNSNSQSIQVGGSKDIKILSNYILNSSDIGISVTTDGSTVSHRIKSNNNIIYNTSGHCIRYTGTFGGSVLGNSLHSCGEDGVFINANMITTDNNIIWTTLDDGIEYSSSAVYGSIGNGNIIYDETDKEIVLNGCQAIDVITKYDVIDGGTFSTGFFRNNGDYEFLNGGIKNITSLDVVGNIQASGNLTSDNYFSGDGTQGMTGSCGAATTLTIKDGLIVGCT